jgi:outer membrane protein
MALAGLFAAITVSPALAQDYFNNPTGYQAGDVLVHLRVIDVIPENFSSSISGIGGHVQATDQATPEVDLSYFLTPHWSVEAIAATSRHEISATGTALGKVDVGSVWALPPTITMQYHAPQIGIFRPYAGVGLTVLFLYDSHAAGPVVDKVGYSIGVGPTLDAGFDVPLRGRWVANFDIKQMFVNTEARINHSTIIAKTALSPTVIGAGIGYVF